MKIFTGLEELTATAGAFLGTTDWAPVDRVRVGLFPEATVDRRSGRVRFTSPIPSRSKLRATTSRTAGLEKLAGAVQVTYATSLEVDGSEKPACVVESIVRYVA